MNQFIDLLTNRVEGNDWFYEDAFAEIPTVQKSVYLYNYLSLRIPNEPVRQYAMETLDQILQNQEWNPTPIRTVMCFSLCVRHISNALKTMPVGPEPEYIDYGINNGDTEKRLKAIEILDYLLPYQLEFLTFSEDLLYAMLPNMLHPDARVREGTADLITPLLAVVRNAPVLKNRIYYQTLHQLLTAFETEIHTATMSKFLITIRNGLDEMTSAEVTSIQIRNILLSIQGRLQDNGALEWLSYAESVVRKIFMGFELPYLTNDMVTIINSFCVMLLSEPDFTEINIVATVLHGYPDVVQRHNSNNFRCLFHAAAFGDDGVRRKVDEIFWDDRLAPFLTTEGLLQELHAALESVQNKLHFLVQVQRIFIIEEVLFDVDVGPFHDDDDDDEDFHLYTTISIANL
uniref:Importin-11 n=1 Tax=Panagrellus redivivus TaxID=6233 RepID=A0A7E4ZYT7_PANRE